MTMRVRDPRAEGRVERTFLSILPALFLFGAGYDFAQREHLMAMAALPYAFAAARRARGEVPRGRIAVSLLAAVGAVLLARRVRGARALPRGTVERGSDTLIRRAL